MLLGRTSQSHRARGRGWSHRHRLEVANQRWYLGLQVWMRQCGMLGYHEKGQCSTEARLWHQEKEDSGAVGGVAQGNPCPAHTVLSPEPQRKPSVSFGGHRSMDDQVHVARQRQKPQVGRKEVKRKGKQGEASQSQTLSVNGGGGWEMVWGCRFS